MEEQQSKSISDLHEAIFPYKSSLSNTSKGFVKKKITRVSVLGRDVWVASTLVDVEFYVPLPSQPNGMRPLCIRAGNVAQIGGQSVAKRGYIQILKMHYQMDTIFLQHSGSYFSEPIRIGGDEESICYFMSCVVQYENKIQLSQIHVLTNEKFETQVILDSKPLTNVTVKFQFAGEIIQAPILTIEMNEFETMGKKEKNGVIYAIREVDLRGDRTGFRLQIFQIGDFGKNRVSYAINTAFLKPTDTELIPFYSTFLGHAIENVFPKLWVKDAYNLCSFIVHAVRKYWNPFYDDFEPPIRLKDDDNNPITEYRNDVHKNWTSRITAFETKPKTTMLQRHLVISRYARLRAIVKSGDLVRPEKAAQSIEEAQQILEFLKTAMGRFNIRTQLTCVICNSITSTACSCCNQPFCGKKCQAQTH